MPNPAAKMAALPVPAGTADGETGRRGAPASRPILLT